MPQTATAKTLDTDIQTVDHMTQIIWRTQKNTTADNSPLQGNIVGIGNIFEQFQC